MSCLDAADKKKLLRTMLISRLGDLREQSLIRQGRGWFHVSGMGHEALAVAGHLMQEGDYFAGYYRDRPIALGRGMSNYELALSFFAKRAGASGGRQMPAHYSDKEKGVFSVASVVAASLLPACGLAWGLKLDQRPNVVITTVGDAGTRQGDFFEAVAFAKERQLPLIMLVEDNGIGISTLTEKIHPLALEVMNDADWTRIDACDVDAVFGAIKPAMDSIRAGGGPQFIWCRTERISSHSSADDHRKYRSAAELEAAEDNDPILRLKDQMIAEGLLTAAAYQELHDTLTAEVRAEFERAYQELDPEPVETLEHVLGPVSNPPALKLPPAEKTRMVDAINATFRAGLERSPDFVFFGQDIEDPKGGVFSLTKGLSTAYPKNVFNSPLAESTILGVAVGLAAYGKRPVFEIQFTDFVWAGFNQLVTNLSTLHWRTNGEWTAPAVIYAPYGGYLPGGAIWHSQANEAALAHFPGLQIAIPSTPEDVAGLFWTAMHGSSPTLILVPKHLMWLPHPVEAPPQPVPFGRARTVAAGTELTLVTWGNCLEVVQHALSDLELEPEQVELIDIRTIVPLDLGAIKTSVGKTGRLLVVQEDAESCSVGQKIISKIVGEADLFARLLAAPVLLAKPDVNVGFNPVLEFGSLPSRKDVAREIRSLLAVRRTRSVAELPAQPEVAEPNIAVAKFSESFSEAGIATELREIRVPILGEGISSARVISLLAKVGDSIEADDALCEVETDKALFPIESPFEGTLKRWHIAEDDEVEVDQLVVELEVSAATDPAARATSSTEQHPAPVVVRPTEGGLPPHVVAQIKHVVPAHMTVKAGFEPIRQVREAVKKAGQRKAPSPTVIIAWALVRAMEQHPIFTCTVTGEDTLVQHQNFDFGIAVALQNDALDTAIIEEANTLEWSAFEAAYEEAVTGVRAGRSRSKSGAPLILTSMGGFKVRDALPVVVPPAIGTLFVGEAHYDDTPAQDAREVVNLCLSFDHRWMNGVAGAQFLNAVVREMEHFTLPARR